MPLVNDDLLRAHVSPSHRALSKVRTPAEEVSVQTLILLQKALDWSPCQQTARGGGEQRTLKRQGWAFKKMQGSMTFFLIYFQQYKETKCNI